MIVPHTGSLLEWVELLQFISITTISVNMDWNVLLLLRTIGIAISFRQGEIIFEYANNNLYRNYK